MARPALKGKAISGRRVVGHHGKSGGKVSPTGGRASNTRKTMSVVSNGGQACSC